MIKGYLHKLRNSRLFKDSFWSLSGNVVGRGLALLAGILVARFLGKDIYGEYGIIKNTILTIGVFSTFGLGYTATKYVAEFRTRAVSKIPVFIKAANKITLAFSGFMALLLLLFADILALRVLEAPHLGTPIRILAVIIIFNAITTTQIGILSGFGAFKAIAKVNSIIGVFTFILSVGLTYFFALNGALFALLLVQVANCILNFYLVRNETAAIKKESISTRNMWRDILNFSTPIALQEAVYSITNWGSSLLLIRLATFGDLGMYTAAMQWNAIILFIPGILRNVILSHLSENTNNVSAHNKILRQTITVNFVATVVPCIMVFLFSGYIAEGYGKSFEGLGFVISVAIISTIFNSISNVYAQAFTSLSKNWLMFGIRTLRDVSILLGFIILVRYDNISGVMAMIYSNLFLSFIFVLIMFLLYQNIVKKIEHV